MEFRNFRSNSVKSIFAQITILHECMHTLGSIGELLNMVLTTAVML